GGGVGGRAAGGGAEVGIRTGALWSAASAPLRPDRRAPLSTGAPYSAPEPHGTRATRKPRPSPRPDRAPLPRCADRQIAPWKYQPPPRITGSEPPSEAPRGFVTFSAGYSAYKSAHHSYTLPCMSYRPRALAGELRHRPG